MSKLKKIVSALLVSFIVISCGFTGGVDAASVYGNTNSNISNGGYAAAKGNYSYSRSSKIYKETEDESYYYIYRTYKNGSTKKQIVNNAAEEPYINIVGNYMYYVGVYNSGQSLGVYRVKTDGTSKKRLISNYSYNSIIAKDNYLFYVKETINDNNEEVSSLCRYNLTKGKTDLTLYTSTTRYINDISLSGDYVYITAEGYDNTIIYKINSKTKKRTTIYKLNSGETSYIEDMVYYKGNIYYTVSSFDDEDYTYTEFSEIYRISSTGKNNKRLTKYYTISINLCNDKIYYVNTNGNICSMNLDGSNRKTIEKTDDYSWQYALNIVNNRMYFGKMTLSLDDDLQIVISNNIYRMTLSGNSLKKM